MTNGRRNIIGNVTAIISSLVFGGIVTCAYAAFPAPVETTTTTTTAAAPQQHYAHEPRHHGHAPIQYVPPPAAAAPVPTTSTTTTTTTVQAAQPAATQNPQNMSVSQFQQWLENNGSQNQDNNSSGTQTTTDADQAAANNNTLPPLPNGRQPMSFQQNQQAMVDAAPPSNLVQDPDAQYAFNAMLQQNMPMSPQQVVQLRQQIDVSQRAAAIPANIPPKPVSSTLMVNLAPGTTPPAIRLAQGYVSSLVFVDSTSSPWPIAAFDIGNPKAVNIQWDGKSNIILMQAVAPYSDGNMVVRLVGLPTPVTLELVSGQRVVDYRVDIHVSGIGPNSKDMPVGTNLPPSASNLLLGVLDGVAPPGSRTLSVVGADALAWMLGESMYLRTRLTVLSPGWIATMSSPDGMHAYELPRTSTVLVSRYGEPAELRIEGF